MSVILSRVWAMPSKWTFQVKPLLDVILRYKQDGECWIDPFAGHNSPAEITNDLNPDSPAQYHLEAAEFTDLLLGENMQFDGAIFDPPYSLTQVSRSYNDMGFQFKGKENPTGGFPKVRDSMSQLICPGGIVISYGWHSGGMGKTRGFEPVEYLLCAHGGNRNDTIVTVERRLGTIAANP